jgi:hypothetical protein
MLKKGNNEEGLDYIKKSKATAIKTGMMGELKYIEEKCKLSGLDFNKI